MLESNLCGIPRLITAFLKAYIAVGRVEAFMGEPDKGEIEILQVTGTQLELKHVFFTWPGAHWLVLHDINLAFPAGLTVVRGKIAAGKAAMLQAILGELDKRSGDLI